MLQKTSQKIGFDLITVTSADSLSAARKFLEESVASQFHADMNWLAKDIEKRITPQKILPGSQSVIMLAKNYYSSDSEDDGGRGYIAKYARFRDYHKEMNAMIKEFVVLLKQQFPGHEFKHYIDYGPLLEKGFALKSGMGFIGKNTTLITQKYGSWVLLSEIISTVPVEDFSFTPEKRRYDNCGTCSKCIDICPTGALTKPYVMDARKCISYLTIENRGSIPEDLRAPIGNHVFGCDLCQKICPFNACAVDSSWTVRNSSHIHPQEILSMRSEKEFLDRFAGTPIMRAKFRGMIRNCSIVAGNLGSKECIPDLIFWNNSDDEMLAEHALWALKKIAHSMINEFSRLTLK